MQVILNQDVKGFGKAGSIIKVKDGFARNFLFPNKLALPAIAANIKKLEQEKQRKVLELEKVKREAESLKEKLQGLSLTMPVLTQEDDKEKFYGSITVNDIANALKEEGFTIDKNIIVLEEPIKALGIYEITVKLHPEISAKVKAWVVSK